MFAEAKRWWFKTFLDLPGGLSSHDTFGRVFAALDPQAFERSFMSWTATLATALPGRLIAFDGKGIRRSSLIYDLRWLFSPRHQTQTLSHSPGA